MSNNKKPKPQSRNSQGFTVRRLVLCLLALLVLFFVVDRSVYSIRRDGYFLPRSADDWAAWGTWVAGLVTAGAFYLTFHQIKNEQDIRTQNERREAKRVATRAALFSVLAQVVGPEQFFGKPSAAQTSALFHGHKFLLTISNTTGETIQNIIIGFNLPLAHPHNPDEHPPEILEQPPTVHDDHWKYRTTLETYWWGRSEVPVLEHPLHFISSENVEPDAIRLGYMADSLSHQTFAVVASSNLFDGPKWFSFTDGQGNQWRKDLTTDSDYVLVKAA